MTSSYEDIIQLPHYQSKVHPRMPVSARAAQFAPFAALTGYEDAVEETARLTEERIELTEEAKAMIDQKLQYLRDHLDEHPEVTLTYFVPDSRKAGGAYVTVRGVLKATDQMAGTITLLDRTVIPIKDITRIDHSLK